VDISPGITMKPRQSISRSAAPENALLSPANATSPVV
jgi:hypothetical protein